MITSRSGKERLHDQRLNCEVWSTFYPQAPGSPYPEGFGTLEFLDEDRVAPGAALPFRHRRDAEILTWVCEGEIAYEDSLGRCGVVRTGELQHMTAGGGVHHFERNASQTEWARVFRVWLRPTEEEGDPGYAQKRFTAADFRGRLCAIASRDARAGSLRIRQDVRVHSALLEPGQHVVHELLPGRLAWVHVVEGEVALGELVLTTGDGAGVTEVPGVSLTARRAASILLLDVGEQPPRLPSLSGAALFTLLWDALVDVLGSPATATIVSRASRRAQPRSPELGELAIERGSREYRCVVPRSFDQPGGPPEALRELLGELRPLLAELTGKVVFRRLEQVPQLREWASVAL